MTPVQAAELSLTISFTKQGDPDSVDYDRRMRLDAVRGSTLGLGRADDYVRIHAKTFTVLMVGDAASAAIAACYAGILSTRFLRAAFPQLTKRQVASYFHLFAANPEAFRRGRGRELRDVIVAGISSCDPIEHGRVLEEIAGLLPETHVDYFLRVMDAGVR